MDVNPFTNTMYHLVQTQSLKQLFYKLITFYMVMEWLASIILSYHQLLLRKMESFQPNTM